MESLSDLIAAATNPDCDLCQGYGWVCEDHPVLAWGTGTVWDCTCRAAGQPCKCTGMDGPQP